MKAAIYARVSTEEQVQNFSIPNQLEQIRKYCKEKDYTVTSEYVDPGYSGTKLERPELTRLLKDARLHVFDIVLVYKLDRFFRSSRHMQNTLAEFDDLGIKFASVTEPFDTSTAMGKAYLGLASTFAEWERNTFMERSRDGTRKSIESGRYSGGIVPYGYQLSKETKKLEINVVEAEVIKKMYDWLINEPLTCYAIAPRLNQLGIPTHYGKTGKGIRGKATANLWRPGRIYNILRNPSYKGEWIYGKRSARKQKNLIAGKCPAIIATETWEKAQAVLKSNSLWADRNSKRDYLLRGLIKCGRCGHSFCGYCAHSTKQGEIRYYRCNRNGQRGQLLSEACSVPSIPADIIENFVWAQIVDFIQKPEKVTEILTSRTLDPVSNGFKNEIDHITKRIDTFSKSEAKLLRLYSDPDNAFSLDAIKTELSEIKKSQAVLERSLQELKAEELKQQQNAVRLDDVEKVLSDLRTNIENVTPAVKRKVVETLLSEIKVDKDEDDNPLITVVFAFDGTGEGMYNVAKNSKLDYELMPVRLFWRPGEAMHLRAGYGRQVSETDQRAIPRPRGHFCRGTAHRL